MTNTDFNPMDELRRAVDTLTTTQTVIVWQEIDGNRTMVKALRTPLIRDLRESITSNVSVGGGNASALPSQRNMIDSDSMQKYDALSSEIIEHLGRVTASAPYMMPEQNLRQWLIAFTNLQRAGKVSEKALLAALDVWASWVRVIEEKLCPPPAIEITAPCPRPDCGKRWTMRDGESIAAITVEYREPSNRESDPFSASVARCRACNYVWRGSAKIRELRFLIDQQEQLIGETL